MVNPAVYKLVNSIENGVDISSSDYINAGLSEKMIINDVFISYKFFYKNKMEFDREACIQEIMHVNGNIFKILIKNSTFFNNVFSEVLRVLNSKSYRVHFQISEGVDWGVVYFATIVRAVISIRGVEQTVLDNNSNIMLHRNIILQQIKSSSEIFKELFNFDSFEKNTIKILILLEDFLCVFKKKKSLKGSVSTEFFISFKYIKIPELPVRLALNTILQPFIEINGFLIGASHLSRQKIIKKSRKQKEVNNIDTTAALLASQQPVRLRDGWVEKINKQVSDAIAQKYNIPACFEAQPETINSLISMLTKKKNKNIKYLRGLLNSEDAMDFNIEEGDINKTTVPKKFKRKVEEDDQKYKERFIIWQQSKELEKELQKLYYNIVMSSVSGIKLPFYIPHFYDFRGRMYPDSAAGFMYLKLLRPYYVVEVKSRLISRLRALLKSFYFKKINELNIILPANLLKKKNPLHRFYLTTLLLEVGKLNKKKLINIDGVSVQKFVDNGFYTYINKNDVTFKLEDLTYFWSLCAAIDTYIKYGVMENITIIRDATASTAQHWGSLLGVREEAKKYLNLDGIVWYDTYSVIIDMFSDQHPKYRQDKAACTFLNRDCLKNVIMIINYNAGISECVITLASTLHEKSMFIKGYAYGAFMADFYSFISDELFNRLYKICIADYKKSSRLIKTLLDADINLGYYKTLIKKNETKIDSRRWIISSEETSGVFDEVETSIAINANSVQALDAEHMRYVATRVQVLCVHDSFGVSIVDTGVLMDASNKYFNIKQKTTSYSIFLLI